MNPLSKEFLSVQELEVEIIRERSQKRYLQDITNLAESDDSLLSLLNQFCTKTQSFLTWNGFRFVFISPQFSNEPAIASDSKILSFSSFVFDQAVINKTYIYIDKFKDQSELNDFNQCLAIPFCLLGKIYGVAEFYSSVDLRLTTSVIDIVATATKQFSFLLEKRATQVELNKNYIEIQNTQQQLIQSEKLASLGTIAAGVAHEINNPLSFLLSNLETLTIYHQRIYQLIDQYSLLIAKVSKIALDESLIQLIKELDVYIKKIELEYILNDQMILVKESLEGVNRISEIVQSLKTFSRNSDAEVNRTSINDCILAALRVASNELKYKCEVIKDLQIVPEISCNPSHLLQVVMNILINAAQSFENKGRIVIKTKVINDFISISIQDNGCGISDENKKKLFTPFFTTKPVGKGTGLGLSVSYGIIKKLGGEIIVDSQVGYGSNFTVKIPIKKEEPSE